MKRLLVGLMATLIMIMPASLSLPTVYAACGSDAKGQVLSGTGSDCSSSGQKEVGSLVNSVVNLLSLVVGIAAVIMIIIAGLKYITAGGDSNNVSSAKNTLLYALIGLVVAALAQFLVHFVLNSVG